MREFDLEAAKRGEPIQAKYDGEWVSADFIGMHHGAPVVFVSSADCEYSQWTFSCLRMAPKKRTIYVNIYQCTASRFETKECAEQFANHDRAQAIAVPIEIED